MIIYTGTTADPAKTEKIKELGLGMMISTTPNLMPQKSYSKFKCALDNGAWACHRKGYPFQEDVFLKAMSSAYKNGICLDFITCPDIVCGGVDSLKFSLKWTDRLVGTPNLALVVQDGMTATHLDSYGVDMFSYIFIGGSVDWKWKTAKEWVDFAHKREKKCHIGGCGTLDRLRYSNEIGADSVDSTSFVRNNSWHILEEYFNWR